MVLLDILSAAARLAELIESAAAGEEVVIADAAGRPVARLVAATPDGSLVSRPAGWTDEQFAAARARAYGTYAGQVWMSEDCFDPLTDEGLKDWGL